MDRASILAYEERLQKAFERIAELQRLLEQASREFNEIIAEERKKHMQCVAELEREIERIKRLHKPAEEMVRAEERERCESIPDTKIFTGAPPRIYCAESWTVGANKAVAAYKEAIRALGDER